MHNTKKFTTPVPKTYFTQENHAENPKLTGGADFAHQDLSEAPAHKDLWDPKDIRDYKIEYKIPPPQRLQMVSSEMTAGPSSSQTASPSSQCSHCFSSSKDCVTFSLCKYLG